MKFRYWLLIMAALAVAIVWQKQSQADYVRLQASAIAELDARRIELADENAGLRRKLAFTYTDEYIIREAREKLGLVLDGEILFEGYETRGPEEPGVP